MKNFTPIKAIALVFCTASFILSCKKADIAFGNQFIDNGSTQVIRVDSFTTNLSTVVLDSFATSSQGFAMLGGYNDPLFGKINTQSYLEIAPPAFEDVYTNTTFDSIVLIMKVKHFYGDSTQPVNIQVHELAEKITLPENTFSIYNNKTLAVKSTPLVNTTIPVYPVATPLINVRVNNSFGQTLLNKLKNIGDVDMKSNEAFLEYFNGIRISSNSSNIILSCSDTVTFRLHYKKPAAITLDKYVDFTFTNRSHQFNNISINRTTPLSIVSPTNKEIASGLTNNAAYLQSATGSMAKLSFPGVRDILKLPNYAKLLKATLIVKPVKGTYSFTYSLPPSLRLATTTPLNDVGPELVALTSNGSAFAQTGDLQVDYFLGEKTQYQYDLTEYFKLLMADPTYPRSSLLLIPPTTSFETAFSRAVIGDKLHPESKTQIQIYYIAVK